MSNYIPTLLYQQICKVLPIPCVDLVVQDSRGRVLLLQRRNDPARGQWWFPGGRVLYAERRYDAAHRKLMEECGLQAHSLSEIATCDLLFPTGTTASAVTHHAITTLFEAHVSGGDVVIDDQSSAASWRMPADWLDQDLDPFVKQIIEQRM